MIRRPPRSTLFPYTRSSDLERTRALDRLAERVMDDAVRLAVRPGQSVTAAIVVTGIHHRQHHVSGRDEVFPHLPDAEVARRSRRQTENVERDRHAQRLDAIREDRDPRLNAHALSLTGATSRQNGLR